jgi:tight adherence protein B
MNWRTRWTPRSHEEPLMTVMTILLAVLVFGALGGLAFALGGPGAAAEKRMAAITRPTGSARIVKGGGDTNQQRRKNVQTMLKELEKQSAETKKRPSLRRRIEQAGLSIQPRTYWILASISGAAATVATVLTTDLLWVAPLAGFAFALGFPRWVLAFLKSRREKRFTREFASAIDTIVRSVKSGLPVNEALKVVSTEIPEPVRGEFKVLVESLKVGVTMEDGLKRMFERMPTPEVNFFGIVMTIQQRTGGNLSEALTNLTSVLRDRKRMQGKIRAMSQEAKSSAAIIGALPPGVAGMIYVTTPGYIEPLFQTDMGNLMLIGCAVWMATGIAVMKKMISFKF